MATELAILADPANRGECDEAMPRPFVDLDSPHPGQERSPYFAPDGKHIAFTASYDGNCARGDSRLGRRGLGGHIQSDQLPVIRTWAAIMALVVAWDSTA